MATSQNGSNTATGSNNAVTFSAVDFQRWNRATSGVGIPSRTVKTSGIPQLRGGLIDAIVEHGVAAVRALSPTRFGIERRYSSDRRAADVGGVSFRGVQLAPPSCVWGVESIFVDRAPLRVRDRHLFGTLAPCGRVTSVQHLGVGGFPSIGSSVRGVSMVVNKPVPANVNVGGFSVSFRCGGRPPTCFVCQGWGVRAGAVRGHGGPGNRLKMTAVGILIMKDLPGMIVT